MLRGGADRRFGPVFTAVVAALGAKRIVTTSIFRLPASRHTGIRDIAAMLEARGLTILNIDGRPRLSANCTRGVSPARDEAPHQLGEVWCR